MISNLDTVDSIKIDGSDKLKYAEKDVFKIYNLVVQKIKDSGREKIKIEEIQDLIEETLKDNKYIDVYESYSSYRERRSQSRKLFFDEKKQHTFLKAIENLSIEPQNEVEIPKNTSSGRPNPKSCCANTP